MYRSYNNKIKTKDNHDDDDNDDGDDKKKKRIGVNDKTSANSKNVCVSI